MAGTKRITNFEEFYVQHLIDHSKPMTKLYHWVGTNLFWMLVIIAIVTEEYTLAPLGIAICLTMHKVSHMVFEKNKVNPLDNPIYSVLGDHKMFFECWTGQHTMFPDIHSDRKDS